MKRAVTILLLSAALLWFLPSVTFAKDMRIGYVNFMHVYNEYQKTQDYDAKLEGEKKKVEKKLEAKKEKIEAIQKKLSVLNEKQKEKEKAKLEKEVKEFRKIERQAFTDIKKDRDEKMKEIFDDVQKVVAKYAKQKKYDLVIDQPAILYGDKSMDITTEILKAVNKKYSGK